jgi:hypothetical protein
MAEFPYATVVGKLLEFFKKIQSIGVPSSVTQKWLDSIGFKSSNDRSILPVAKFIGFVDASNKPTQRWTSYRSTNLAKSVMAEGIREGYSDLFSVYPDAYERSDEDLKNFFRSKSAVGDQAISKTVSTFRTLCSLADFTKTSEQIPPNDQTLQPTSKPIQNPVLSTAYKHQSGITININIELSLPPTTDKAVYENLFAALKKHILPDESDNGD